MKIVACSARAFSLPLRAPFRTAAGSLAGRAGLVLRIETDSGIDGLGEAMPHPALGANALAPIWQAWEHMHPRLIGTEVEELEDLIRELPAPLACALDVAACDLLARERGVTVAALLGAAVSPSVAANATIGVETTVEAASQAWAARAAGFTCVKLKVGMAREIEEERQRVAAVRAAIGPSLALRLDANGAWDPARAVRTIRALEEYGLEFVEQPVAADDLAGLARVARELDTPIAADESIAGPDDARRVLDQEAAQVLVIKPMVVGGVRPARRIAEMANAAGVAAVVTTTIDGGIGVAAALHLAATLPSDGPACGLATASLLAGDIVAEAPVVRDGRMVLPSASGLGVTLDERAIARFACADAEPPK